MHRRARYLPQLSSVPPARTQQTHPGLSGETTVSQVEFQPFGIVNAVRKRFVIPLVVVG
jgi:hypothetical protein